jgi:chitinase
VNSNGTITGNNSGLCLSTSGNSSALKATADINTCDGDSYEKWTAESNGTIVNGASGLCLSVTGSSTALKATGPVHLQRQRQRELDRRMSNDQTPST